MNKMIACYTNDGKQSDILNCDYVQIELLGPHAKENNSAILISKSSLNLVVQFKWYLGKNNYPVTYSSWDNSIKLGRGLKLHKLLHPKLPKGYVIDHINRDRLDNRMENLRVCTQKQNSYNTSKPINSKNKYKGVTKQTNGLFTAKITKDNQVHEIKDILNEKHAGQIYDMMAEELFGEYAGKNFQ